MHLFIYHNMYMYSNYIAVICCYKLAKVSIVTLLTYIPLLLLCFGFQSSLTWLG